MVKFKKKFRNFKKSKWVFKNCYNVEYFELIENITVRK